MGPEASAKVLLSIVKQYPGVAEELNLPKGFGDMALLKALADAPSPSPHLDAILKLQGCKIQTRRKACSLLPMALQAVNPPRKPFWTRRRTYACLIVLGIAEVCVLSAALALWITRQAWRQGTCALRDFWNMECVQSTAQATGTITACEFEVQVATGTTVLHTRWTPPATPHYHRLLWDDAPFRCCDDPGLPQRRSCCSLQDDNGHMCDNWSGRFDSSGVECPSGGWPCLFKTHKVDGAEEVMSLDIDRNPPIQELFISAGLIAFVAGCLYVYWVVRKMGRHVDQHKLTVVQQVTSPPEWDGPDAIKRATPEAWAATDDPPKPPKIWGNYMEAAGDSARLPERVSEPLRLTEVPVPATNPRILDTTSEVSSKLESFPSERPSGLDSSRSEYAKIADHAALGAQNQPGFLPPRVPKQPRGDKVRGQTRGVGSTAGRSASSSPYSAQRGTQIGRGSAGRAHSSGRR